MKTHRSATRLTHRCLGRRLVAVDIENVVGGACLVRTQAEWVRRTVSEVIGFRTFDQIVVGTSHIGLIEVGDGWPHIRYVVRSGQDGADLALLDVFTENIAMRFSEVVLVSGDGIFTEMVSDLAAQGVHCTVVSHEEGLSRRLRLAATEVRFFPGRPPTSPSGSIEASSRMAA